MKIVMVVGRSTGGIGTHVVDLASDLRQLGVAVTVVADSITIDAFGLSEASTAWPRGVGPRQAASRWRELRALVRSHDVVHAHGHQGGVVAVSAARLTPTPIAVSVHNAVLAHGVRGAMQALAQRYVATSATLVTGASSDLVEQAAASGANWTELAPVPSPRVPALLASAPADARQRAAAARALLSEHGIPSAGEAPLIVTIARIAPQKGLDVIAPAWLPGSRWVVLGGGEDELHTQLTRQADELGAEVYYVGAQRNPDRWLRAADVFVLPSVWEARALVVQEALAAGVPVIARDVGGLPDLLDGVGALLPADAGPQAFTEAIQTVLDDPVRHEQMATAGRARARTWPDGKQTAQQWRDWYAVMAR